MTERSKGTQKPELEPPQFSFIMNIAKLLDHDSEFHNPWIVVTLPEIDLSSLSKPSPFLAVAQLIRSTISDARRRPPVGQIIQQHVNVRNAPMGPAYWRCREPNIVPSS